MICRMGARMCSAEQPGLAEQGRPVGVCLPSPPANMAGHNTREGSDQSAAGRDLSAASWRHPKQAAQRLAMPPCDSTAQQLSMLPCDSTASGTTPVHAALRQHTTAAALGASPLACDSTACRAAHLQDTHPKTRLCVPDDAPQLVQHRCNATDKRNQTGEGNNAPLRPR